jgi:hypothetical protein
MRALMSFRDWAIEARCQVVVSRLKISTLQPTNYNLLLEGSNKMLNVRFKIGLHRLDITSFKNRF